MKLMHWQAAPGLLAALMLSGWPAEAQIPQVFSLHTPISGQPSQLLPGSGSPPSGSGPGFDAIAELQPGSTITPPDPNVAIGTVVAATGEQYLVESVNKGLRAFRTNGAPASSYTPFAHPVNGFFSKPLVSIFDPRLVFDPYTQRFVLIALERDKPNGTGFIHIAVSESADPLGAWHVFKTGVPTASAWHPDYPSLAVDRQAVYIGANLFIGDPAPTDPPDALLYRAIAKSTLFSPTNPQITTMIDVVETTPSPQYHWAMRAAQPYGLPLNAPAVGLFLGSFRRENDPLHTAVFQKLRAVKMRNPLDFNAVSLTGVDVPVPAYSEPSQDGPQKCAGQTLDVSSGQIQNAVWRKGDLYAAHTVPVAGVNTVRWYQIRTGPPDAPVAWSQLVQDGEIRGDLTSQHTYLPAVGVDGQGSLVIAYAQSSANDPVSFRIAARAACDAHSTTQYRSIVKVVDQCYLESTQAAPPYRWGDYWGVAVDPASPPLLWAVGEYVKAGTQWGTWIVPIVITPDCPACACSR